MTPKKKSSEKNLIVAILVAAAFITAGLFYLGYQMTKGSSADLQGAIEQGIKDYVQEQQQAQQGGNAGPSEPVNVSVDDDPVKGDADAPVTMIEFSDYECPFCNRYFTQTYPQIVENYVDEGLVKIVFRDFPLSFHPNAMPAAIAAECLHEQTDDETYFAYHDKIFENQSSISEDNLIAWASEYGADIADCLANEEFKEEVQQDFADGQKAGVRGTPAFFINGRTISGAQPYAVFESVIEEELNK